MSKQINTTEKIRTKLDQLKQEMGLTNRNSVIQILILNHEFTSIVRDIKESFLNLQLRVNGLISNVEKLLKKVSEYE